MNIIQAVQDPKLFLPYFNGSLATWDRWQVALRCLHGLPIKGKAERALVKECTGRDPGKLPRHGFRTALFLVGRRSGKSRVAGLAAAFEAALSGREKLLSPGEIGLVAVVSPTRAQSRIVRTYIRAAFDATPILQSAMDDETKDGFRLKNGVEVQTLVGDFRTVRGFTLLAAVVDEVCFFHLAEEGKVRSDTELIAALRPGLSTTKGLLLCIGSPYAERGWAYTAWKKHYGNNASNTLVWRAPSMQMNPTLDSKIIADAMAEDPAVARAEYFAEWRQDIAAFITRELVEQLVIHGRQELPYRGNTVTYHGFADVSGGRSDDAALAIAHMEGRMVILDCLQRWKAPHNPYQVIAEMVATLRRYCCDRATGDAYAAEFTKTAFESHGIQYERCTTSAWKHGVGAITPVAKPKSVLYAELLPRLTSGEVELLDNDLLVTQLAALERRTRSGGRDVIDHPTGGHDDLANVLAGVCDCCQHRQPVAGVMGVFGASYGDMLALGINTFNEHGIRMSALERRLRDTQDEFEYARQEHQALAQGGNNHDGNEEWAAMMRRVGRA